MRMKCVGYVAAFVAASALAFSQSRTISSAEFEPPLLNYGDAAFISLEPDLDSLHRSIPSELWQVADSITRTVWNTEGYMSAFAQLYSDSGDTWRALQFRLMHEDFVGRCYGWSDTTRTRVIEILDSLWGISRDSKDLLLSATFQQSYAQYGGAARQLVSAFEPIVAKWPYVRVIAFEARSDALLTIDATAEQGKTDYTIPFVLLEEVGHIYGTSVVPAECQEPFETGKHVLIRYFNDTVHLVYAHYPVNANSYYIVAVLRSPVPIRLRER
jgi:hypothetical protein